MDRPRASRRLGAFWLLSLPAGLAAVVFIFVPVGVAVLLSFFKLETVLSSPEFAGLDNFRRVLASGEFWPAFIHGLVYAVIAVLVQIGLGLVFALVLNERFFASRALRGAAIFPYVIPAVVGIEVWKWMLNENVGVISTGIQTLGAHISWFSTPNAAMLSVILISVWLWTPFVTVCLLAGLQDIPQDLHEAAHVDGASAIRRFWHVTLPGLMPIIVVVGLLRSIWMFNKFDVIYLATGGGPLHSTEHLPLLAYRLAFGEFDLGGGAAVAALNAAFVLVLVLIYLRLTRRYLDR